MTDHIVFLENILKDLKSENILEHHKLNALDEFIFKFDNPPDFLSNDKLHSDKDFISFALACWYFYQIIIKNSQPMKDNSEIAVSDNNIINENNIT